MRVLRRIFPKRLDGDFAGHRAAVWLLLLALAIKALMAAIALFMTSGAAAKADGIPLDRFDPAEAAHFLLALKLLGLAHLALLLPALAAVAKYRPMIPFACLLLLLEHGLRALLVLSHAPPRSAGSAADMGRFVLILLASAFVLSLLRRREVGEAPAD